MSDPHEPQSYYDLLGIKPGAALEEIKRAYRRKVRTCHPDLNRAADPAHFKRVQRAYEVLRDPARRKRYDAAAGVATQNDFAAPDRSSFNRLLNNLCSSLQTALDNTQSTSRKRQGKSRRAG
ncbi:MAG: J domain-containing protein [Candidatus Brocadiae bacterium]|nr:J domain-containing protein [Candidatus Brocadiia bacterium]